MLQFCPTCRNADVDKEIVSTAERAATAACHECGERFQFPYRTLYTLEGPPATGKSTTTGRLDGRIELALYEGDMHIDLTDDDLSWEAICELDFRICQTLHAAGRQALFVGGMYPYDPADSPESRYFAGIERCALVCDDGDLESRVRDRPGGDDEAVEFCLSINEWYREEGPSRGIEVVNTTALDPAAVADRVVTWLESGSES